MAKRTPHVVIIGGGFGGLYAAKKLSNKHVRATIIDKRNFHLFQPLLYQVATGGLSPANIASPIRGVLSGKKNMHVLMAEVQDVDLDARQVVLPDRRLPYDTLIVAAGAGHHYFGNDHWENLAPSLKTIEDATHIRHRILEAFEAAEQESDPVTQAALLTFVIVGGGPTGVELAGTLGEIAHHTFPADFRNFDSTTAHIILLEGNDRILPTYPPTLSAKAQRALEKLAVNVRTGAFVTDIRPEQVAIRVGDIEETISTHTVLWAAGVKASPLGETLARQTGAETDRMGRVHVEPDLTLPGHPEVFVIGDLAYCVEPGAAEPLPGLAPVAIQQGKYVARAIVRRLKGKDLAPFHYKDYGVMATIGRAKAVAQIGRLKFSGYPAWLAWLFVHLMYIVEFGNRILILMQWAGNYITRNRSARLITGTHDIIEDRFTEPTAGPGG